jgi:hypothetical protein
MKHIIVISVFILGLLVPVFAEIQKILLVGADEIQLEPVDIIRLPGIGLGMKCIGDSIMVLDHPQLPNIAFIEPTEVRSIVAVRSGVYAANGDSIFRMPTPDSNLEFIGRLDNEDFKLYQATDSTFFACTADENFSCVYEIFPEDKTCTPGISIEAPILTIEGNGKTRVMWVDDTILRLQDDGVVENIYQADNITCMTVTPIGIMVGTTEGVFWLTGTDKGAKIIKEAVKGLWWNNPDTLYYLTDVGDLIAVYGIRESYLSHTQN